MILLSQTYVGTLHVVCPYTYLLLTECPTPQTDPHCPTVQLNGRRGLPAPRRTSGAPEAATRKRAKKCCLPYSKRKVNKTTTTPPRCNFISLHSNREEWYVLSHTGHSMKPRGQTPAYWEARLHWVCCLRGWHTGRA